MRNSMRTLCGVSALLLAASILLTLTACQKKNTTESEPIETVSDKAVEYLNRAIKNYATEDFRSKFTSKIEVMTKDSATPTSKYAIIGECLVLNDEKSNEWMVDLYVDYDQNGENSTDPIYFSTCYLYDQTVYHQFDKKEESKEENYSVLMDYDDLTYMGLYSIGNAAPASEYGVKQGDRLRVDLIFLAQDISKMQTVMIRQLLDGAFCGDTELALVFSNLTFSAMIDAKNNRIESYSLIFTATSPQFEEGTILQFDYTEIIDEYGVDETIDYPDFSKYTDRTPEK